MFTPSCCQKTFFCKVCKAHLAHQSCFVDCTKATTRAPKASYANEQESAESTIPFGTCPACRKDMLSEELLRCQREPESWPEIVHLLTAETPLGEWMQEQIPALQESVEVEAGMMVICTFDISTAERKAEHAHDENLRENIEERIREKRMKQVNHHVVKRARENIDMMIWDASGQKTHAGPDGQPVMTAPNPEQRLSFGLMIVPCATVFHVPSMKDI